MSRGYGKLEKYIIEKIEKEPNKLHWFFRKAYCHPQSPLSPQTYYPAEYVNDFPGPEQLFKDGAPYERNQNFNRALRNLQKKGLIGIITYFSERFFYKSNITGYSAFNFDDDSKKYLKKMYWYYNKLIMNLNKKQLEILHLLDGNPFEK